MIKAILLDADGVLINAELFSKQLERDHGISTDKTTPFFSGIFQECLVDKVDLRDVLKDYLPEWGWKGTVDEFIDYWFKSGHSIEQPIIEFVKELDERGIDCYLATNNEKHRVKYMMEQMGFGEVLKGFYSSASLGYKKPDAEFFKAVADDLHLAPEEILFWDDDEKNVTGAKEFGIHAELYSSFDEFKKKTLRYLES